MHCRCPHCHNPIEIVADDPMTDIECPSCGSHFELVTGQTTSPYHGHARRIAHFELLDLVGTGKFGSVWKAQDTELDRTVAVKIPRAGQLDGAEAEQFVREARAAAQVTHPHIVSVHEVGRADGTIYIVSDFIDGANLKAYCQGRPLNVREAGQLCATIADALHAAHEAGVIHRDLKPQNVMVDGSGSPHVADFGLAKRDAGEITMTVAGKILGTPAYMPPEQACGRAHEADRRADIYSLGVMLYELLTGELPFRGERQMILLQIQRDEPVSPRKLVKLIPRDMETITLKCLEKEPDRRYATAADLAEDLRRFLAGQPILAKPVGRLARAWKWSRRNRSLAIASSVAALALCAVALISLVFALQKAHDAQRLAQAGQRARDSFERASRAVETLVMAPNSQGDTQQSLAYAEQTVQMAAGILDSLEGQESNQKKQWRHIHAVALANLGQLQKAAGDLPGALDSLRRSRDIFRELAATAPDYDLAQRQAMVAHNRLGQALAQAQNMDEAIVEIRAGQTIAQSLAEKHPDDRECQDDLLVSHLLVSDLCEFKADYEQMLRECQAALALAQKMDDGTLPQQDRVASCLERLGNAHAVLSQLPEALAAHRESFSIRDALFNQNQNHPQASRMRYHLAISLQRLGDVSRDLRELESSRQYLREARDHLESLLAMSPANASYEDALIRTTGKLGWSLSLLAETPERAQEECLELWKEAEIHLARALELIEDCRLRRVPIDDALVKSTQQLLEQARAKTRELQ